MRLFFLFFFVSGFCSILYEIIWLRLSMAHFGVTSALISIVLSSFMAGLGLGSWGSGYLIRRYPTLSSQALRLYALLELIIGISALVVPLQLAFGSNLLEHIVPSASWRYYIASGGWIVLTLLPWCICMGATIPVAMLAIRKKFSFFYLANVLGAVAGAIVPLFLIELYGFRGTLYIGAAFNGILALAAIMLSFKFIPVPTKISLPINQYSLNNRTPLLLLFLTGLTSMGMELVWIRQFTSYLGTEVYSFALILALYLACTYMGSQIYRKWRFDIKQESSWLWVLLGISALLPVLTANPHIAFPNSILRLVAGIGPFSALLGFVTPMLVDRWSQGNPDKAGFAYAINIVGCILGPLLAGFLLLPFVNERWALLILSLPWLLLGIRIQSPKVSYAGLVIALLLVWSSKGYEDLFLKHKLMRDSTATVVAAGEGMKKRLLVNGVGITHLTPITKMMAHLPLAFLDHTPRNTLVICFGMGTTYRSLLSWDIPATAVELVPSVPQLFGYYHADGPKLLSSSLSHMIVDDGRRYLKRSKEKYDVITIDPPPPVSAVGTGLLYSKEFYVLIKKRLQPNGILQQWLAEEEDTVKAAVMLALQESFQYVRVFHSAEGWGYHFLASDSPIPKRNAAELVQHMPAKAIQDLIEWSPNVRPQKDFSDVLNNELSLQQMVENAPGVTALKDDHPVNEYFILRRIRKL